VVDADQHQGQPLSGCRSGLQAGSQLANEVAAVGDAGLRVGGGRLTRADVGLLQLIGALVDAPITAPVFYSLP
jgi:hypothetical protein